MTTSTAHPRIGLLGNPSDLYGGRGIGFTTDAFAATITLADAPDITIDGPAAPLLRAGWEVFAEAALAVAEPVGPSSATPPGDGQDGAPPATPTGPCLLREGRPALTVRPFAVTAHTDIPRQVGLAGSSALLTAFLDALATWCGLALPPHRLAWLVWRAEQEKLGIRAGPMDRLCQAFGGLVAMDFTRAWDADATRRLDASLLPPVVLAWDPEPGQASGAVHADVYAQWQAGDPGVVETVSRWAPLVERGLEALQAGDLDTLIACVDTNFELRAQLFPIAARDQRMIDLARAHGAGAKFCGSGGAVLAVARDEAQRDALLAAYRAAGFGALAPTVCGPPPPRPRGLRAVILAAGFATRLYPLTRMAPKPLLDVGGVPMLTRLLRQLEATGAIADVVVVHNTRFVTTFTRWRDGLDTDLPVHLVDNGIIADDQLRGAVADLSLALERAPAPAGPLDGHVVAAGDNLIDQPLDGLVRRFEETGDPRLLVRRLPEPVPPKTFSEVIVHVDGQVTGFREKPADPASPYSALALYLLPPDLPERVTAYLARDGAEHDAPGHLLAWLCATGPCQAERVGGRWFDVGNIDQLKAARSWADGLPHGS
jgi:glucuronokinase